jgi:hypothetical protein
MPIDFDIEELRNQFGCEVFFETGMWDPRTNVSSKQALRGGFEKVFCIEIRDDWVMLGNDIFKRDIEMGRYTILHDDSVNMQFHLDRLKPVFEKRTMFFLDAHVDNTNIKNFKQRCPLMHEIGAIGSLDRKDHIILIDDVRILKQNNPWGDTSLGNTNWISDIKDTLLKINPMYKFMYLNGHIQDDVLCAYI